MPAQAKRILITRTRQQASEFAAQLELLGAIPILIPTIEIVPPASYASLDAAIGQLHRFDWLLFTSANAVEVFDQRRLRLAQNRAASSPDPENPTNSQATLPRIGVIGPATARAVQSIGLPVDLMPPQYVAESLAAALLADAPGRSFLLIRAAEARDHLPQTLTAAGASVTITEAYRNQVPPGSIPALQRLFSDLSLQPDAITFTSASTARNLFDLLEAAGLTLPPHITFASIGPITSQTLRDLGHPPTVEAATPTISALVQALLKHYEQS